MTDLKAAETVDGAWDTTVSYMRGLGASHVHISMDLDQDNPMLLWTSDPWVGEKYRAEVHPHSDPSIDHCRKKLTAYMSGAALLDRDDAIPGKWRDYLEELVTARWRSAILLPVHCALSSDWGRFSFGTDEDANGFDRLYARHGHSVQMAGTMAFNQIRTLLKRDRAVRVGLTDGERECLLWFASGMRQHEIADHLGIRSTTVKRHLEGARRKLKAKTLAQALANAMQLGVIEP